MSITATYRPISFKDPSGLEPEKEKGGEDEMLIADIQREMETFDAVANAINEMNQINAMFDEMRGRTAFTNEFAYDYGSGGGGSGGARNGKDEADNGNNSTSSIFPTIGAIFDWIDAIFGSDEEVQEDTSLEAKSLEKFDDKFWFLMKFIFSPDFFGFGGSFSGVSGVGFGLNIDALWMKGGEMWPPAFTLSPSIGFGMNTSLSFTVSRYNYVGTRDLSYQLLETSIKDERWGYFGSYGISHVGVTGTYAPTDEGFLIGTTVHFTLWNYGPWSVGVFNTFLMNKWF